MPWGSFENFHIASTVSAVQLVQIVNLYMGIVTHKSQPTRIYMNGVEGKKNTCEKSHEIQQLHIYNES